MNTTARAVGWVEPHLLGVVASGQIRPAPVLESA